MIDSCPSTRASGTGANASCGPGPSSPAAPVQPAPGQASMRGSSQEDSTHGARPGEMRHIPGRADYSRWDFLKGAGPSAPPRVLVHTAKDTGRFKAGWHSKKAVHAIRPDKERVEAEQQRAHRSLAAQAQRSQRLSEMSTNAGFDPITGELRNARHTRSREEGIKCFPRPQTPPSVARARHVAAEARFQARADLIRREGLAPRPVTVADNFKPEHYL